MLDNDISTASALHHLSVPEAAFATGADAHALDRLRFLQLVGIGLGAGLVAGPGSSLLDTAFGNGDTSRAAGPIGAGDGILIVLGICAVSQIEAMKRAAFREGFNCAINETTQSLHSSYQCRDYREAFKEKI